MITFSLEIILNPSFGELVDRIHSETQLPIDAIDISRAVEQIL